MKAELRIIGYVAAAAALCVAAASCDRAADEMAGADAPGSRAGLRAEIMPVDGDVTPPASVFSPKTGHSFAENDSIGFFSDGGNFSDGNDGTQGFSNFPLVYDGMQFVSDKFKMDVGRLGYIFAYYPYLEGMETEEGVSAYSDKEETKGRDFLLMDNSKHDEQFYTTASFRHAFAVVRVKLGEGFEDFKGEIFVQMKRKVKNVRVDMQGRDSWDSPFMSVKLVFYDDEEHLKKENRRLPTFEQTDGGVVVRDAIVPCRFPAWRNKEDATIGGVTVEAIILKAEDGTETEIPVDNYTCFSGLWGTDPNPVHGVRGGFIYTLEVRKEGFEATVFPYSVDEWNEGKIEETLPVGIGNLTDYQSFVAAYNTLFEEGKTYTDSEISEKLSGEDESVQTLKRFGTEVADADGSKHFTLFLTSDIDFAGSQYEQSGQSGARINNLVIPLDGRNHTIRNLSLQKGFCGTLSSTLKNLRFESLTVTQAEGLTDAIGMLADKTSSAAMIEGCTVGYGRIVGNEGTKVGAAVGTMEGGVIRSCTFDGFMSGTLDESHKSLVGDYKSGTVDENNKNNMVK